MFRLLWRSALSLRRHPLVAVLALAAVLRFVGLDWDEGRGFHPDERRIVFALEEISFVPPQLNPHFFAYGSFPLYVQRAWGSAAAMVRSEWGGFHGRLLTGRAFSAVVALATIAWLYALGARLWDRRTGLLAALFLSLAVLHIQHSHFITFDLYQGFFTVAVLERLAAFSASGRRRTLVAAAVLTGLALATKASSAPLLLPLALGAIFVRPGGAFGLVPRLVSLALALGVAATGFAAGEPYAFLDPQFLHDVREQGTMVRAAGNVPYTIQYIGTRPYLDDLHQAFLWGFGPVLGLAAAIGTLAALGAIRRRALPEILVLAFFIPYFLVTGWFPVKFMRYLLPLYPLWCLYAAHVLIGMRDRPMGRLRTTLAVVVIAATAFHAFAFFTIYLRPHVWVTASRWFYANVPARSTVLRPHWEEGFPVDVAGRNGGAYKQEELPFYEPDDDAKIALLAERLAQGDALVFPSKRIYGAITNVPHRYPKTNRFFELLFAGDLGYRLEAAFASRPRLLGIELDDDFADESFSVYDHPKTLVFRKVEPLDAAEIEQRVRSRLPSTPMTRAAILGAGRDIAAVGANETGRFAGISSSFPALALWAAALAFFSIIGRRMLSAALPRLSPEAVGGLGPVFGLLLFVYTIWLSVALGLAPFTWVTEIVAAIVLGGIALRRPAPFGVAAPSIIYWATFLFFVTIRAWTPEVFWGEKPMDFSFLNALYRTETLPPPEPWMSGRPINYPYFGHFCVAAIGKLTGIAPALAFNLGIATVAASTAAAAFGAGAVLTGKSRGGVLAALLVVFAGNLAGPVEMVARRTIDFHYFWATSRVIANTINEFPLWSFLFADLHAHVMSMPFSLLFLGLTCAWALERPRSPTLLLLASFALGAIAATNTWSYPVYAGALAGLAFITAVGERRPTRVLGALCAAGFAYVWFAPFWLSFVAPPRNWGWEIESAPLRGVVLIFGVPLFVLASAAFVAVRQRVLLRWVVAAAAIAIVMLSFVSVRAGFFALGAASLVAAFASKVPAARLALALGAGAAWLGAVADTIYLWDRMNTIFKLYLEMWIFFALGAAYWLSTLRRRAWSPWLRWSWTAAASLVFAASIFTAITDVIGTLRTQHVQGPRPTLDGQAYLGVHRPADGGAIRWLNREIAGSPVVVEAQGDSYQEFSRISMNTGLPTVLGWGYHLSQRAHPWSELRRREADVATIYEATDRSTVEEVLDRYHVALVYVGELERRKYAAPGLEKFSAWKDLFQPVYENPKVQVFAVPTNFRWDAAPALIEALPSEPEAPSTVQEVRRQDAPGQLSQPRGIAVDGDGNVWVADFGNNRIQVFDRELKPVRAFGELGDGAGQFNQPCAIAIGPDGRVYVADTWNHRVQVFERDGTFVRQWSGDFYGPRGIAVAADGSVYVADTGNGRVAKFTAEGKLEARWGKKGSGAGELSEPIGLALGGQGNLFVADSGNRRIVELSAKGDPVAEWKVPGWEREVFREPFLVSLPDGRLVASDPPGNRVFVFNRKGEVDRTHVFPERTLPVGVASLTRDRLVTSQIETNRIASIPIP